MTSNKYDVVAFVGDACANKLVIYECGEQMGFAVAAVSSPVIGDPVFFTDEQARIVASALSEKYNFGVELVPTGFKAVTYTHGIAE